MDQQIRAYDAGRDLDAVVRTWTEIGWIDGADKAAALQAFLAAGNAEVGLMEEEAECMVHWVPGSIQYDTTPLPLCAITAVTTSRVARKQGLASSMTSRALVQGADAGCAVAALGMFEQGFYDRFGFGTAAYEQYFSFDPSALMVDHIPYRPPQRIDVSQWADMHRAMAGRMTAHGSVVLGPPEIIEGEVGFGNNPFGLGYRDDTGSLTHFVFGELEGEHGPWRIEALAYESAHQLLELLRLIHELGDQIRSVMLREPPHVQLQVLLADPFRERNRSRGSSHESFARSVAWWQLRILDLDACVRARTWAGTPVRFNLELTDPIEERLTDGWRGVAGDYSVTIGETSTVTPGPTSGLPTLRAGVGAFTRIWFGVGPASTIAVVDDVDAPDELLAALDTALALPRPVAGWAF